MFGKVLLTKAMNEWKMHAFCIVQIKIGWLAGVVVYNELYMLNFQQT